MSDPIMPEDLVIDLDHEALVEALKTLEIVTWRIWRARQEHAPASYDATQCVTCLEEWPCNTDDILRGVRDHERL